MKKSRFKNAYSPIQFIKREYSKEQHTIEGQSMSVREILSRFTRGENLSVIPGSPTFTEQLNLDVRRMDRIQLDEYYKNVKQDVLSRQNELTVQQRQKAIKDAQERFKKAVDAKAQELSNQKVQQPITPE